MNKIITLISFSFLFLSLQAQVQIQNQVLSTSGESYTDGLVVIDFTFGETFTSSFSSSTNLITQGFEQPIKKKLIIIEPIASVDEIWKYDFSVYPNPFSHEITIEISNLEDLFVAIYDNSGRLVYQEQINSIATTLELSQLAVGNYQVKLFSSRNELIGRIPVIKTP